MMRIGSVASLWVGVIGIVVASVQAPWVLDVVRGVLDFVGKVLQLYIVTLGVAYVLHKTFITRAAPHGDMPVLMPLQIATRNEKWYKRTLVWLMSKRGWRVCKQWTFLATLDGRQVSIVIPQGFEFDGASVPRPFWFLLDPMGLLLIPGIIHDYAYRHRELLILRNGEPVSFGTGRGRLYWDKLLFTTGKEANGFLSINIVVCALVCLFGWLAWPGSYTKCNSL